MATCPGANHTFSVSRDIGLIPDPLHPQNQIDGGKQIVYTGLSILIKPLLGVQEAAGYGIVNEGRFSGLTFSGTDLRPNDDLLDSVATVEDGITPVTYTIVGVPLDTGYYLQMFLRLKAF